MLCVEIIVVTATVDRVLRYCVVCGDYCDYSKSRYSAMVLCCVWRFFMVTAKVEILQLYCDECGIYCG